jgi:Tfp pilus assembly protein PilV
MTVVEVLVALVIVSVGLLGAAGSLAIATRALTRVRNEQAATTHAVSRLAVLAAAGCDRASSGTAAPGRDGMEERWIVEHSRSNVALLASRVEWQERNRAHALVLRSAVLC